MRSALFRDAVVRGANLWDGNRESRQLDDDVISPADLNRAHIYGSEFVNANLAVSILAQPYAGGCQFRSANLKRVDFLRSNLGEQTSKAPPSRGPILRGQSSLVRIRISRIRGMRIAASHLNAFTSTLNIVASRIHVGRSAASPNASTPPAPTSPGQTSRESISQARACLMARSIRELRAGAVVQGRSHDGVGCATVSNPQENKYAKMSSREQDATYLFQKRLAWERHVQASSSAALNASPSPLHEMRRLGDCIIC